MPTKVVMVDGVLYELTPQQANAVDGLREAVRDVVLGNTRGFVVLEINDEPKWRARIFVAEPSSAVADDLLSCWNDAARPIAELRSAYQGDAPHNNRTLATN